MYKKRKYDLIDSSNSSVSLYVTAYPSFVSECALADYFSQYGNIAAIRYKGTFSFVEFTDSNSVDKTLAVKAHYVMNERIQVARARPFYQHQKQPKHVKRAVLSQKEIRQILHKQKTVGRQMVVLRELTRLPPEDIIIRDNLLHQLQMLLRATYPECTVHAFGSTRNGLGTIGCDLDIFVDLNKGGEFSQELDAANVIKNIHTILLQNAKYLNLQRLIHIPAARCPLVRFTYLPASLQCDVSVKSRLAMNNTELLLTYCNHSPYVPILMSTARYWAKARVVCGIQSSLNSYAFTLLVLVYLQKVGIIPTFEYLNNLIPDEEKTYIDGWNSSFAKLQPSLTDEVDDDICRQLLQGFFQFYSALDLSSVVIHVRSARAIPHWKYYTGQYKNAVFPEEFKVTDITIQDPIDFDHNTSRNVNWLSLQRIQREFGIANAKINSNFFYGDGEDTWGINTLLVDNIPDASIKEVENITPILNTINLGLSSKKSVEKGEGDVRMQWFENVAQFIQTLFTEYLLVELSSEKNENLIEQCRDALQQHEPIVQRIKEVSKYNVNLQTEENKNVDFEDNNSICINENMNNKNHCKVTIANNTRYIDVPDRICDIMKYVNGVSDVHSSNSVTVNMIEDGVEVDCIGEDAADGTATATEEHNSSHENNACESMSVRYVVEDDTPNTDTSNRLHKCIKNGNTIGAKDGVDPIDVDLCLGSSVLEDINGSNANLKPTCSTFPVSYNSKFEPISEISKDTNGNVGLVNCEITNNDRKIFNYAKLKCICTCRFWERRNVLFRELTIVENYKKDLQLEKIITQKIKDAHPRIHFLNPFHCDINFIIGSSTAEVQLVFELPPGNTQQKEFRIMMAFLNKYIPKLVKDYLT